MVAPPDLVKTVSTATGVAVATVTDLDRKLAKAGLRPVGGRGLNAAKMGPMEAARLLTAVLASPQSNEAAEAVSRYMRTCPDRPRSSRTLFGAAAIEDLAALPAGHSFVDGLSAVIASLATGSLAQLVATSRQKPHVEAFAFTRATHGRIRISGLPRGVTVNVEYIPAATGGRASRSTKPPQLSRRHAGDLEQSRRITEKTIAAIAQLLSG